MQVQLTANHLHRLWLDLGFDKLIYAQAGYSHKRIVTAF